jgi:DNA-binding transcriptional LysR family regulator
MIQLADVQIFLEIVRTGNFSEAARALRMPKSSVARQIARLEQDVGCRLLDRSSRIVSLTPAGLNFVPHARRLFDDGIEAQNAVRTDGKGASGVLSVATTGLIGRRFVAPYLPQFLARHPAIRVNLWLGIERHEIGPDVGQVDIAIRLRSVGAPDIGNRKLGEIDFRIVASPAYVERHGQPATPAALADHRLIELGPAAKHNRLVLTRGGETATIVYAPCIQIDDPEAVRLATLVGGGVAVLPAFLVDDDIRDGRLIGLLPDWCQPPIPIHVLYRTHSSPPIRVRAFIDHLVDTIMRTRPWRLP